MRKKRQIYVLYLISKEKGNLLKIGITRKTNLNSRIKNIEKDFGKINYKKSYICYSEKEKDINNLEKLLHKTFYSSRKEKRFKEGVGKTEWFKADILNEVKKQILFLKKNNKNYTGLSNLKRLDGKKEKFNFSFILSGISYLLYITLFFSLGYLFYSIQ